MSEPKIQLYHPVTGQPMIVAESDCARFESYGFTRSPEVVQKRNGWLEAFWKLVKKGKHVSPPQ